MDRRVFLGSLAGIVAGTTVTGVEASQSPINIIKISDVVGERELVLHMYWKDSTVLGYEYEPKRTLWCGQKQCGEIWFNLPSIYLNGIVVDGKFDTARKPAYYCGRISLGEKWGGFPKDFKNLIDAIKYVEENTQKQLGPALEELGIKVRFEIDRTELNTLPKLKG